MAFVFSYAFIAGVLGIATLFEKTKMFNDEGTRKFIHIAVAHWFILAIFIFDNALLASIVPFSFIILNYLSYRYNLVSAMERDTHNREDLGTVYYAVSLTIITFIAFQFSYKIEGLFAILAMGYGDGFGAVIGKRFGKTTVYSKKTYIGSTAMLFFTLIIGYILFPQRLLLVPLIALSATLLEIFTLEGYDNLSVPLFIFLLSVVIL